MNYFIGLDAHSKTCSFTILCENGSIVDQSTVATTEKTIKGYLKSVSGYIKLTFEESFLSQWLYVLLYKEVDELIVCNPTYLPKNNRTKNDLNDSFHLANQFRINNLVPVYHEDCSLMRLRSLNSGYNDIIKASSRAKHQFKSLLLKEAIIEKSRVAYKRENTIEQLSNEEDRFVAETLQEVILKLDEVKEKYYKKFEVNKRKYKEIELLSSIPGIGNIRAHAIASAIGNAQRFSSKYKFWSYSMLVKHQETSAGVLIRNRNKYGRVELKYHFISAAITVRRTNSALKKYHDNLMEKGLDPKKAKRALARKIAAISLQVLKTGKKYSEKEVLNNI